MKKFWELLGRSKRRTEKEDKPKECLPLTEKRKGEIAWQLMKRRTQKNGLPLKSALARDIGNLSQAIDLPKITFYRYFQALYVELHNELFPLNRIELEDDAALPQPYLEFVSLKIIEVSAIDRLHFDKVRLGKEIADASRETSIGQEELWSFFQDVLKKLFYKGIKLPPAKKTEGE